MNDRIRNRMDMDCCKISRNWCACNLQKLLLDYYFDNLNLRRVKFKIDVYNLKSQKAIEKLELIKKGF